jgi:hypothetical protein
MLQNLTNTPETVTVTLTNMLSNTATQNFTVGSQSRATVNITDIVINKLINNGDGAPAYAVSINVTGTDAFIAERTMHWNAFGTQGAESVVGYAG